MGHGMVGVQMRRVVADAIVRHMPDGMVERLGNRTQDSLGDGVTRTQHAASLILGDEQMIYGADYREDAAGRWFIRRG